MIDNSKLPNINYEGLTCLDAHLENCSGQVEYRPSLSGTGKNIPRCDSHWTARLKIQEQINQRYAPNSNVPPEGFDPTYAGERWDENY